MGAGSLDGIEQAKRFLSESFEGEAQFPRNLLLLEMMRRCYSFWLDGRILFLVFHSVRRRLVVLTLRPSINAVFARPTL